MTSARLKEIEEIFHSALDRDPGQVGGFLTTACAGDESLRRKVEELLASHEKARSFIEIPAVCLATKLFPNSPPEFLSGHTIGHYELTQRIGAGGMGEVYLASDLTAGRKAALKILPSRFTKDAARLRRFEQEARAVVGLNHPNILTIYEVGQDQSTHYIASELVEGETLRQLMGRGPMGVEEAIEVAIQVASALVAAHEAGIVHRDIKPENIMLRRDGYIKVLDFGIAKLAESETRWEAAPGEEATSLLETQVGTIVGTARYLSPEQARGEAADARTDLWALGVVLYEMLAGRAPFAGGSVREVIVAITAAEPPSIPAELPEALARLLQKALQREVEQRYQTAREMREALQRIRRTMDRQLGEAPRARLWKRRPIASSLSAVMIALGFALFFYWSRPQVTAPSAKSIAVLPFENLSPGSEDAYLADGIQNDILTSVGKLKDLKVIARTSVAGYRGAAVSGKLREIGQTLGVFYVLQGSVRRERERVVVSVALVDTRDRRQVWAERYERTLTDSLSLQGELAVEIARELSISLTANERSIVAQKPTENPEAYLLYLRARERELALPSETGSWEEAIRLFQEAINLDPKFALARARLSIRINYLTQSQEPPARARARAEAEEALRLRPDLGEASLALALCYLWGERDYVRALRELKRAGDLAPNAAEVPLAAAFAYLRQGKIRERIIALERAETLDPRDATVLGVLARTQRWVRDWPGGLRTLDRMRALLPDDPTIQSASRRALDEFHLTGDINVLKAAHAADKAAGVLKGGQLEFWQFRTAMLERDYAAAERFLAEIPAQFYENNFNYRKSMQVALLAVARGADRAEATRALEKARAEVEALLAPMADATGADPDNLRADLAFLDSLLGRTADALREAERAIAFASGPVEKTDPETVRAIIHARHGDADKAITLLEHLLTVPGVLQNDTDYNVTLADLRWSWVWDPLRANPRFQKLLASPEPVTRY